MTTMTRRLDQLLADTGPISYAEAASALGVKVRAVYRAAEKAQHADMLLRTHDAPRRWTDEKVREAIRRVTRRAGSTSSTAYRAHRDNGDPSLATIFDRYESWDAALVAAGIEPRNDTRGHRLQTWSDDQIVEAVRDSGATTVSKYAEWRAAHGGPAVETVLNRFGGWNNVRRRVGR